MLTRLKVRGFKNLWNVDVQFGPFTCIAGPNGVGKSNLFDAILFLSALADRPVADAAKSVRDEAGRSTQIRDLFFKSGNYRAKTMSFEVEMLVPPEGEDDLGQKVKASITFLRYSLELELKPGNDQLSTDRIEVVREELHHINRKDAANHLPFRPKKRWLDSVATGERRGAPFISTVVGDSSTSRTIQLHQDGGARGKPRPSSAAKLPRTVLSSVSSAESPTVILARREMQSWKLLQLEPSALRASDPLDAPAHIDSHGAYLASALYHLNMNDVGRDSHTGDSNAASDPQSPANLQVAHRLSELVDDVGGVCVDIDRTRELLTLQTRDRAGCFHPARALSDGTLRFIALSILQLDSHAHRLICLEEPENGINPRRIKSMLRLLQGLAFDSQTIIDDDNPLRQVIINTHSPLVVLETLDNDLLYAEPSEASVPITELTTEKGEASTHRGHPHTPASTEQTIRVRCVRFTWPSGTWRAEANPEVPCMKPGYIATYLGTLGPDSIEESGSHTDKNNGSTSGRKMGTRTDYQLKLFPVDSPTEES